MKSKTVLRLAFLTILFAPVVSMAAPGDYWTGGYNSVNSTDVWRITENGNLLPGTNGGYNIGDANFRVSSVTTAGNVTVGGILAVTGATTHTGALTQTSTATFNSWFVLGEKVMSVTANSTVPYAGAYMVLASTGVGSTFYNLPTIATTTTVGGTTPLTSGSYLVIAATSTNEVSFVDNDTLSGTLLDFQQGITSRTLNAGDLLTLIFDARRGRWVEQSYNAK